MKRFRDPDWIRTNDPQLRRLMLYPAELPDPLLVFFEIANVADFFKKIQENLDLKNTPFPLLLYGCMISCVYTLRNQASCISWVDDFIHPKSCRCIVRH